jgi:hypothetical protein
MCQTPLLRDCDEDFVCERHGRYGGVQAIDGGRRRLGARWERRWHNGVIFGGSCHHGRIVYVQPARHTIQRWTRCTFEGSTVAGGDLELSGVCGGSHRPPLRTFWTFLACAILPVPPKFGCWSQRLEVWRRTATTICPNLYLVSENTRS